MKLYKVVQWANFKRHDGRSVFSTPMISPLDDIGATLEEYNYRYHENGDSTPHEVDRFDPTFLGFSPVSEPIWVGAGRLYSQSELIFYAGLSETDLKQGLSFETEKLTEV